MFQRCFSKFFLIVERNALNRKENSKITDRIIPYIQLIHEQHILDYIEEK